MIPFIPVKHLYLVYPINNCKPAIENTVKVNIKTKIALDSYPNDWNNAIIIDLSALTEEIVLKGLSTLNDLRAFKLTDALPIIYGIHPVTIIVKSSKFQASLKYEVLPKIKPYNII